MTVRHVRSQLNKVRFIYANEHKSVCEVTRTSRIWYDHHEKTVKYMGGTHLESTRMLLSTVLSRDAHEKVRIQQV